MSRGVCWPLCPWFSILHLANVRPSEDRSLGPRKRTSRANRRHVIEASHCKIRVLFCLSLGRAHKREHRGRRTAAGGSGSVLWVPERRRDDDGPDFAGNFYGSVFSNRWGGMPHHERTAEALRDAVKVLRRKRKKTLERWVNLVHYGA